MPRWEIDKIRLQINVILVFYFLNRWTERFDQASVRPRRVRNVCAHDTRTPSKIFEKYCFARAILENMIVFSRF